jgi:hypothetical protein
LGIVPDRPPVSVQQHHLLDVLHLTSLYLHRL